MSWSALAGLWPLLVVGSLVAAVVVVRGAWLGPGRAEDATTDSWGLRAVLGWRQPPPRGAQWARPSELAPLLAGPGPGRLRLGVASGTGRMVGTASRGGMTRGRQLTTEVAQSVAIIGPTQSGKTSCLAVPAILGWCGPVLAASVKTDLLRDTASWRAGCGRLWCVDPAEVTGMPPSRWTPLKAAATWSGARRVAADMTEVGRGAGGTTADGEFWYSMAAKLLAPLLFAASSAGRDMADVARWVDTQEVAEVLEALEDAGCAPARQAAEANWLREERQRSSVYTTVESVLEPFLGGEGGPGSAPDVDPDALLEGDHTLYVCAPAHDQRRLVGLFTAVVKDVVQSAFTRAARAGGPLDPPLLVVLDEAANIAPLAELDGLASTCAGHGVQLVTVWQDLAQINARYGSKAATVVNNHRAKVVLAGISDPATLDHVSHLVGERDRGVTSFTKEPGGRRSTTVSSAPRPLLPGDELRRMAPGTGVLLYGSLPPVRLALRPWWEDPVLSGRGPRRGS